MKIAVMGAGGVGGYYGGRLCAAGEDVTLIARGAHLAAILENGLQVRSAAGDFHVRPKATQDPAEIGPVDLVLFCVKSYDTEVAARQILPITGPDTVVLCVQNGVDNEDKLARIAGAGHILAGVVHILSTVSAPGVIDQTAGPRTLRFGELDGRLTPRTERILRAFRASGVQTDVSTNVQVDLWQKFLFICAQGGVTAMTRLGIGEILGCQATLDFYRGVMEEIYAVASARGVILPADSIERTLAFVRSQHPDMRSSLAHDLEKGNRLEVEALVGTVVRFGREAGVPTPFCFAIYACLLPHHLRALAARRGPAI